MKPAAMETAAMETAAMETAVKPATAAHHAAATHAAVAHATHALGTSRVWPQSRRLRSKEASSQTHLDLPPRVSAGIIRHGRRIIPNNPSGFIRFCRFLFVATTKLPCNSGPSPGYDRDPRQTLSSAAAWIGCFLCKASRSNRPIESKAMLTTTRDMVLPTAITGSYPRPLWYDANLNCRSVKSAMGDSLFREQYLDACAAIINAQEAAGLDIVTDGDSRSSTSRSAANRGSSIRSKRLGGVPGTATPSRGWMQRHGLRPGRILWEVQEAYSRACVTEKLTRGPLEYTAIWQIAQRLSPTVRSSSARSARPARQHAVGRALP